MDRLDQNRSEISTRKRTQEKIMTNSNGSSVENTSYNCACGANLVSLINDELNRLEVLRKKKQVV